jgi:dihydroneopterin aldolase / 2-amino-4-hydroxy-6-hydroxymethyldihydropteridine diphosphokinase / dihydropteroate synthase
MIPDFVHPSLGQPLYLLLSALLRDRPSSLTKVIPFPHAPQLDFGSSQQLAPSTLVHWMLPDGSHPGKGKGKSRVMAILNVTPDSFSDGSVHNNATSAVNFARAAVRSGADVVDVGGYSTRPNAPFVSLEEELTRTVPIIKALRNKDSRTDTDNVDSKIISIDTFRPEVASAAIIAGANCINDVYAFGGPDHFAKQSLDDTLPRMKELARKHAVPVILMHSRGDASQNKDYTQYNYSKDPAVIEGIRVELGTRVSTIIKGRGGIRRWLVIVDPGIGFSKTVTGNLEVLKYCTEIVADCTIGPGLF